jgi:hypothetical protein
MVFQEHKVMLCLDPELYSGFIKLQADKGLGRAYAGLLPYVEGLFRLGYISEKTYLDHFKKYSEPLVPEVTVLSPKEKLQRNVLDEKDRQLKGMLESWDLPHYTPNWQQKAIAEAQKYPDLPSAKLLLAKAKETS